MTDVSSYFDSDGIGFQTISYLVNAGAKVYMGARDESKAREAIDRLRAETPKVAAENIIWLPLELSDLRGVVKAAEIVKSKESRLDILSRCCFRTVAVF